LRSLESTQALRGLFAWIESRFGGQLPMDTITTTGSPPVVTAEDGVIRTNDLVKLMQHQITALHVRQFYQPLAAAQALGQELAAEAAQQARNWQVSTNSHRGLESSDVWTLGEHAPYNVVAAEASAAETPEQKAQIQDDYFNGVLREFQRRRLEPLSLLSSSSSSSSSTPSHPRLWPLDLFRLQLDEAWPAGAGLARETGDADHKRPFGGGLARIMKGPTRWRKGYIHVDEMGPLNAARGLFSANIYLQLPPAPAPPLSSSATPDTKDPPIKKEDITPVPVLHIWPVGIRSRWDWYRNALLLSGLASQDAEDQVRLRLALGEPLSIAVQPGDLVLICAQRPHAAIGFQQGVRVSLQCFVQHQGLDQRLLIDC